MAAGDATEVREGRWVEVGCGAWGDPVLLVTLGRCGMLGRYLTVN